MKFATAIALVAAVEAKHHHKSKKHSVSLLQTEEQFEAMGDDQLLSQLESTLSAALSSEAHGVPDAAVAKTAAIKNIQKALTARILKRLDDG